MTKTDSFAVAGFPTLTTDRLILREFVPSDAPDVFAFRGNPEVQKWDGGPAQNIAEVSAAIERDREAARTWERLSWAITLKDTDIVIGDVGLANWAKDHHRAEIGYTVARAYWRQGIGTEAVRAVVRFGFQQLHLHRIEAFPIVDNVASLRLLEKAGFTREGTGRECLLMADGAYHGVAQYAMLRREFLSESR